MKWRGSGGAVSTLGVATAGDTTTYAQLGSDASFADLTLTGDLTVGGTTTTVNAVDLVVSDPLIYIGEDNQTNVVDLGVVGSFNDGTYQHTGLVRDATDGKWKLFSGVVAEPTTTVDFTSAVYDVLKVGTLEGNVTGTLTGNADTVTNGVYTNVANAFTVGGHVINANNAIGLTVNAKPGYGAIFWYNRNGTFRGGVDEYGILTVGTGGNGGNFNVRAFSATEVAVAIRGAASQTANLQEWQDSAANILARIDYLGNIIAPARVYVGVGATGIASTKLSVVVDNAAFVGQVVRGASSQAGALTQWQDSSGTVLSRINATGQAAFGGRLTVGLNDINNGSIFYVSISTATQVGAVIRGVLSQTANLQEWHDSTSAVLSLVTSAGLFESPRFTAKPTGGTYGLYSIAQGASAVPIVARGASSQTGNLTEWQDSSGVAQAYVTSGYSIYTAGRAIFGTDYSAKLQATSASATMVGAVIRGAASQSANLQEWQDSAGTVLAQVNSAGSAVFANIYPTGRVYAYSNLAGTQSAYSYFTGSNGSGFTFTSLSAGTTVVPITIRGVTSQVSDLTQYQTSAAAVLGGRNALGQIYTGSTSAATYYVGGATTATSGTGTVATVTVTATHSLSVGQLVTVSGVTPLGYNGTYVVTAVPTTTSFSYANATTGSQTVAGAVTTPWQASITGHSSSTNILLLRQTQGGGSYVGNFMELRDVNNGLAAYFNASGSLVSYREITTAGIVRAGTNTNLGTAQLHVLAGSASTIGAVIRGAVSQTANLQEWQNNDGTVRVYVNQVGNFFASGSANFNGGFNSNNNAIFAPSASTVVPVTVKGAASQSANLQEWQDSAGTVLTVLTSTGRIAIGRSNGLGSAGVTVQGAVGYTHYSPNNTLNTFQASMVLLRGNSTGLAMYIGGKGDGLNGLSSIVFTDTNQVELASVSQSGQFSVYPNTASTIGLLVKGVDSHTANLTEWQNSSGTVVTSIRASGGINTTVQLNATSAVAVGTSNYLTASLSVIPLNAAVAGIVVKGYASQTANLFELQNSSGTVLVRANAAGTLTASNFANGTILANVSNSFYTLGTGFVGVVVRGVASQTAHLVEYQFDTGTVISGVEAYGRYFVRSGTTYGTASLSVGNNGNPSHVNVVVRAAASQTADLLQVQDSASSLIFRVKNAGQVNVASIVQDIAETGAYLSFNSNHLLVQTRSATNGFWVRGAASQTANLQEWQDSAGTVLANISSSGSLTAKQIIAQNALTAQASAIIYGANAGSVPLAVLGRASQTANLQEWKDSTGVVLASISATGTLTAVAKSFLITHPTKPDMKLQYGSLEGPENGVYVRGTSSESVIELPDYWTGLVDETSITVQLTAVGRVRKLYVKKVEDNKVFVGKSRGTYFYTVFAERKDIGKLTVEF